MSENSERLQSLEQKLNAVIIKLAELEKRLELLEQKPKPTPRPQVPKPSPGQIKNTYLAKAILAAKREYESKR